MHRVLPNSLISLMMMAQACLIAALAAAWTMPAVAIGAAVALASPPRRFGGYSTTIRGAAAARRASTASHFAQTRAAMAR